MRPCWLLRKDDMAQKRQMSQSKCSIHKRETKQQMESSITRFPNPPRQPVRTMSYQYWKQCFPKRTSTVLYLPFDCPFMSCSAWTSVNCSITTSLSDPYEAFYCDRIWKGESVPCVNDKPHSIESFLDATRGPEMTTTPILYCTVPSCTRWGWLEDLVSQRDNERRMSPTDKCGLFSSYRATTEVQIVERGCYWSWYAAAGVNWRGHKSATLSLHFASLYLTHIWWCLSVSSFKNLSSSDRDTISSFLTARWHHSRQELFRSFQLSTSRVAGREREREGGDMRIKLMTHAVSGCCSLLCKSCNNIDESL